MPTTELLSNHIARTGFEDLPGGVVRQAKRCIQNVIGCAYGGAQTELGRRQIELALELGGNREATLIGDGAKVSRIFAAYANAEVANSLDFDDGHYPTYSHPSAPIVASAFAIGEPMHASGKEIITAVALGFDVGLRLALAMRSWITQPDGKKDRLQVLCYMPLAAAAATCKLLKLNGKEINNAFGVVGSTPINHGQSPVHVPGATTFPYAETKYNAGTFALVGVFGTLRSRRVQGLPDILDGERFWKQGGATGFNVADIENALGKEYRIMDILMKPYPFCGQVTRVIDAIRAVLKGETLTADQIEEITLIGVTKLPLYNWKTMTEAEFSAPCAAAFAVTGIEAGPRFYTSGRYLDADIYQIASKVKFIDDPVAKEIALREARYTCTAEIKTKDGQMRKAHIEYEKGIPENPLSENELHAKFLSNARDVLGEKRAEKLWQTLSHLEEVEDVSGLFRMPRRKG